MLANGGAAWVDGGNDVLYERTSLGADVSFGLDGLVLFRMQDHG